MTKNLASKKSYKKMIICFALVICVSSAFADQTAPPPKVVASAQELEEKNLCFFEGKAFSEGAKFNGMTCQHKPTVNVFGKNKIVFQWQEDVKATSQPLVH
jgi:hypothetical protein